MTRSKGSWILPLAVGLTAGFGVFVLPFFFPPALSTTVSVSNAAGYNNKVAAVAAAACAVGVFFLFLRWPKLDSGRRYVSPDVRPLSWRLVTPAAIFVAAWASFLCTLAGTSPRGFRGDNEYFINQMTSHLVYHRQLYSQIEFPYGPLLFYPPILLHALFRGLLSIKQTFFVVQVLHQVLGIFLLGYLLNSFPMGRRWKILALWCFALFTLQPMLGPNYTLVRFALPLAMLVFSIRQRRAWQTALLFVLGQMLTLSISPEMGFAFGSAAISFSLFQAFRAGWRWLAVALVIPVGTGLFLLIVGTPYLRMLGLFAGGTLNFIVEPVPYILLFLSGVVWLVPRMLAARFKENQQDAALLGSCFVLSMALLPVALGRADPVHVFFNGVGVFLLSMIALSTMPEWQQRTWGCLFAATIVFPLFLVYRILSPDYHWIMRQEIYAHRSSVPLRQILPVAMKFDRVAKDMAKVEPPDPYSFDIARLETIVHGESVATPYGIGFEVEDLLKQRGLYRPDFYYMVVAVLDATAEQRKVDALNQAHWALIPTYYHFSDSETQANENSVIGSTLTYPSKPPYKTGRIFAANLQERWQAATEIGPFTVYRNLRPE